ncbi:MAG: peroxiredoxin family protein [Acetobacteraceae bacterium]|nr:peroxiredoxin family protein [Acetobacteraceae bacterium]
MHSLSPASARRCRARWLVLCLTLVLLAFLAFVPALAAGGCARRLPPESPPAGTPGAGPSRPGAAASSGAPPSSGAPSPSTPDKSRLYRPFQQLPAAPASQGSPFKAGQALDDFALPRAGGGEFRLADALAGSRRGALVSFVAPGSLACRSDLLLLGASYDDLRSRGLELLVIVDCGSPEEALAYAREQALHMPVLADVGGALRRRLGVQSLPLHIVVRPDRLVWKPALGWAVTDRGTAGLMTDLNRYLAGPGG